MYRSALLAVLLAACGGGDSTPGPAVAPDAPPSCVPTSCAALGFDCGSAGDGCGGTLACGTCAAPLTCGGATPNVCGAQAFAFDEKTLHVSGVVTSNGVVPDQSCAGDELRGQVFFYAEDGVASFALPIPCATAGEPFTWSGDIYPGAYRVAVMGTESSLPPMTITVASGLEVRADRDDFAFDVANHRVAGTLTQNGVTPSCTAGSEAAQVLFDEPTTGAFFSFPIPCPDAGQPLGWSGTVTPGTYRVRLLGENVAFPTSMHTLETALPVEADVLDLAHDVTTYPISGTVTLNGQVPGQPASCRGSRGHVSLESTADGAQAIQIPCAAAGTPFTFSGVVYAGSYVVTVTGQNSDLPNQTFRPGLSLDVGAPVADLALDVTAHPVAGTVTLNGAAPAACIGAIWGQVSMYEAKKGYSFNVDVPCAGGAFAFAALLYPGTYGVWVSFNGGEYILVTRALEVAGPADGVSFDAVATEFPVSGTIAVNGDLPGCDPTASHGEVHLDDLLADVSVTLPYDCVGAFSGTAPAGTYRISVAGILAGVYIAPTSLVVSGPVAGMRVDVPTRRVAGSVTSNGASPNPSGACAAGALAGHVEFVDPETQVDFTFPARCGAAGDVTFEGDVYPGTYDVNVYGIEPVLPAAGFSAGRGITVN